MFEDPLQVSQNTIQILVRPVIGTPITLDLLQDATIASVKTTLHVAPSQKLTFAGQLLEDVHTLQRYNIHSGDTLYLDADNKRWPVGDYTLTIYHDGSIARKTTLEPRRPPLRMGISTCRLWVLISFLDMSMGRIHVEHVLGKTLTSAFVIEFLPKHNAALLSLDGPTARQQGTSIVCKLGGSNHEYLNFVALCTVKPFFDQDIEDVKNAHELSNQLSVGGISLSDLINANRHRFLHWWRQDTGEFGPTTHTTKKRRLSEEEDEEPRRGLY